jgi:hypothetical protein
MEAVRGKTMRARELLGGSRSYKQARPFTGRRDGLQALRGAVLTRRQCC